MRKQSEEITYEPIDDDVREVVEPGSFTPAQKERFLKEVRRVQAEIHRNDKSILGKRAE